MITPGGYDKHVECENPGVGVVAKVTGVISVETHLGGADGIEVPVRREERGWIGRLGNGDHEIAHMQGKVDVLITDDESAIQFVVDCDRVGQCRTGTGTGQPTYSEKEVAQGVRHFCCTGRFRGENRDLLVDSFHKAGWSSRAIAIRRDEATAVVKVQAWISIARIVDNADGTWSAEQRNNVEPIRMEKYFWRTRGYAGQMDSVSFAGFLCR